MNLISLTFAAILIGISIMLIIISPVCNWLFPVGVAIFAAICILIEKKK